MPFSKNHAILRPKDSGICFGQLTDEELRALSTELTERERALPHARYYSQLPAPLPEEYLAALKEPMDASCAFGLKDYGKFMNNRGHCAVENGYCVLPDGVTYAAVLLRQEGRTDEIVDHYNRYFAPEESLFYKLWHPKAHYLHYTDGALEDFGFGRVNMRFVAAVEPEDLGIRREEIEKNDPACIFIGGTSTVGYRLDAPGPRKLERNTIVFYYRQTDYGREVRVRLWYGAGIEQGEYHRTPLAQEEAMDIARKTMLHVMEEYTNDQYLEMKFWQDSQAMAKEQHPMQTNV